MTDVAQRVEQPLPVALAGRMTGLDEAYRMAKALAQSALLPESLRNKPSDVLVTILYGQELGLAPMQSMQVIDVVKGRPFIRAQLWVALARKAGHKVRKTEDTVDACTVEITRSDDPEPHIVRFTIEDAKLAGFTTNKNYATNPKAMLYARAATTACRQACPEVALGFGDEVERDAVTQSQEHPTLAQVAHQRDQSNAIEDAEVVEDDDAVRAQVEALQAQHVAPKVDTTTGEVYEPDEALLAEMAAEMAPDRDDPPSGLFGGE